jgi:hypothetical protein
MPGWHPPLHAMRHPISHLVTQADLELRADGAAHLVIARAQLAGNLASDSSDASSALDAAFEDFQEIQNRNAENWHRGPVVDVEVVADDLAETFYLKGRVAETAANVNASRSDLGRADDFYRRAAEQLTPKQSYYQKALLAFRARTAH